MRLASAGLVALVIVCLIGCQSKQPSGAMPGVTPSAAPTLTSRPEAGAPPTAATEPSSRTAAEPCDPSRFALNGYEVRTSRNVDLDGDGRDECLIACQYRETDELGDPREPAYFTIAREVDGGWVEWLSIPAPDGETFVDDKSIMAAEDLNGDGSVDLMLRFYTFGVSGRAEPLYVWRVTGGGVEPEIVGGSAPLSSHDGVRLEEVDESCPGPELVFAHWRLGDEAVAEPHRYEIEVWGWQDGQYDYVSGGSSTTLYDDPDSAIEAFLSGADYR